MARSRAASVSGTSPFAPPPLEHAVSSASVVSALALAGRESRMGNRPGTPGASVYRSAISTIVQQSQETVTLTFKEAVEPRVLDVRPPCRVRRPGAPRFRSMPSPSAAAGGEASATSRDDASGRRTPGAASLSPLSIGAGGGSGRASPRIELGGASQHPFDDPLFASGLMAAGYSEMIDISRKKIKTRFSHGLGKEHFKLHLDAFLEQKGLKTRGEYMIRFVGQQDVHSPFVHVYTTSLLTDVATIKIFPDNPDPSDLEGHTLWTHLRIVEGPSRASHWSCRKNKFWPLRVVLEGPTSTDIVPSAGAPPSPVEERPRHRSSNRDRDRRSDDEASLSPSTKSNTRANSAFVNLPKRQVVEPPPVPPPALELPPPPPGTPAATGAAPTILASVKQLGVAVAHAIPPQVQTTIQSQVAALRSWMKKGEEDEGGSEDEEARRERRRARRQARREREERESMGGSRGGRREMERDGERDFESREEKEARRAERRRLRAQAMG